MKYRGKPKEVEAIQFTHEPGKVQAILEWVTGFGICLTFTKQFKNEHGQYVDAMLIPTLEGTMAATRGDWIVKGVKNEFYPCKHDVFEKTYEKIDL